MSVSTIYVKPETAFSTLIEEWASDLGVQVEKYDVRVEDHPVDGLLLINENQDIEREMYDLHSLFDKKHIPTQKIDVNGTLQVAVSNFEMWLRNFKCKNVLILGSDKLVSNENLQRFLDRIRSSSIS